MSAGNSPRECLSHAYQHLHDWLMTQSFPRWARDGVDVKTGRFIEAIERDGSVQAQPLRLRVQARQVFAFAEARRLGWPVDTGPLLRTGLVYLSATYQRADGLFRTLAGPDGRAIDERALLYDQAFVLLAYAAAGRALGEVEQWEARARLLRMAIGHRLRDVDGLFFSDTERTVRWEFNPHMHLLEACLAWEEIGQDPEWHAWASDLMSLTSRRFMRADSGLLVEWGAENGRQVHGESGRRIEPGHQYEWAWLLLRANDRHGEAHRTTALALIDRAERAGIVHGRAINALLDDLSVHDGRARLWPQTERLKAAVAAGLATGEPRHTLIACSAAESLIPYLNKNTPGLWFDQRSADGAVERSGAPASTLYHLVGAIGELRRALAGQAD